MFNLITAPSNMTSASVLSSHKVPCSGRAGLVGAWLRLLSPLMAIVRPLYILVGAILQEVGGDVQIGIFQCNLGARFKEF